MKKIKRNRNHNEITINIVDRFAKECNRTSTKVMMAD